MVSTDVDSSDRRSSMSTGAIVGIVVGVILFGVFASGAIIWVYRRRHPRAPPSLQDATTIHDPDDRRQTMVAETVDFHLDPVPQACASPPNYSDADLQRSPIRSPIQSLRTMSPASPQIDLPELVGYPAYPLLMGNSQLAEQLIHPTGRKEAPPIEPTTSAISLSQPDQSMMSPVSPEDEEQIRYVPAPLTLRR